MRGCTKRTESGASIWMTLLDFYILKNNIASPAMY